MTTLAAIVCAHTMERWTEIVAAIESIEGQSRPAEQVIIAVDNNGELHRRLTQAFDPQILVVHNTGERGVSATRNVAARATDHDVLVFLDDDAAAEPGWLEALATWFEDPDVMGVGGLAHPRWAGGSRPAWFPPSFDWVVGCSHSGVARTPTRVRNFIGCNMAVRRSAWLAVGGFDEHLGRVGSNGGGGDETDFCIRLTDHVGGTIVHEPAAVVSHNVPSYRQTLRYFIKRCHAEGISKAEISQRSVSSSTMGDERRHLTSTLPRECLAGFVAALQGDAPAFSRSLAILAGTTATVAGFLRGRLRQDTAEAREPELESFAPARVTTIDLRSPSSDTLDVDDVETHERVFALVRNGSKVVGVAHDGVAGIGRLARSIDREQTEADSRSTADPGRRTISVVIATRDRPESLRRTLQSLAQSRLPPDQVVVVDSAPSDDAAAAVVSEWRGAMPMLYLKSERPGLAVAHNVALDCVETDLVAMTDDDVLIDEFWLEEIERCFRDHPEAVCVTGAIMPAELETWPQLWVERSSGFHKGFDVEIFDVDRHRPADDPMFPFTAGTMGSGANMSFETAWLRENGGFREALGAGSVAMGGDDLRAFYDVVNSGRQLVYNPHAVVFHHHHRTAAAIERQSYGYGAGLSAFLASVVHDEPRQLLRMARVAPRAVRRAAAVTRPAGAEFFPRQAQRTRQHRKGIMVGPVRYVRSVLTQP